MFTAINKSIDARRDENEKGFTLIELLVVILIIGVLAAIAIPAFLNQREGAWVAQVESDLKNASIAAESYAIAHNGSYASLSAAELDTNGYNKTADVTAITVAETGTAYTLTAGHTSLGARTWTYDSDTGIIVEN